MKPKTHRGAAKRFRLNAAGKIKRKKANLRHILTKKSPDRKRRLGQKTWVKTKGEVKRIIRMLTGF